MSSWPRDFERWNEDEPWVTEPVGDLARKYDSVENHGWYRNLEPTERELLDLFASRESTQLWLDYSGGTGILIDRVLRQLGDREVGALLVDASPKFLRLALEKLAADERTAFRWIRYLKEEKRLERLDEVLPASLLERGVDVITSTNAIHLYYGMKETLRSWYEALRPGGKVLVQSGNIDNPDAPEGSWIIDLTVERLQEPAREIVRTDDRFALFRDPLEDHERDERYRELRQKFFLPVRPLDFYLRRLEDAGFELESVRAVPIEADVSDWLDFLGAYHEGVLGWAGGSARIDGEEPSEGVIELRLELLRESLDRLFEGRASFEASWTYITCRRPL